MKALRLGELPEVAPETLGVGQLCAETTRTGLGGGSICRQGWEGGEVLLGERLAVIVERGEEVSGGLPLVPQARGSASMALSRSSIRALEDLSSASPRSLVDDRLPLVRAKTPAAASARVAPMARALPSDFIVAPPVRLCSVARADDTAQVVVLRW